MQTNGFYVPVSSCNSFSKLLLPISVLLCISISALPAHLRSPSAGSVSQSSDSIWLSPGVPLSEISINFIPESNSLLASSTRWSGALAKPHHLSFISFLIFTKIQSCQHHNDSRLPPCRKEVRKHSHAVNPLPKACKCWCCARCTKIGIRKAPRRVPIVTLN